MSTACGGVGGGCTVVGGAGGCCALGAADVELSDDNIVSLVDSKSNLHGEHDDRHANGKYDPAVEQIGFLIVNDAISRIAFIIASLPSLSVVTG